MNKIHIKKKTNIQLFCSPKWQKRFKMSITQYKQKLALLVGGSMVKLRKWVKGSACRAAGHHGGLC